MEADDAVALVVRTAWREIIQAADDVSAKVCEGRPKSILNPFTNKSTEIPLPPCMVAVHQKLAGAGLLKDEAFLSAFRGVLREAAEAPVWGLFTAIDGEGAFEEDARIELRFVDGDSIPGYLHEVFYKHDPERSKMP